MGEYLYIEKALDAVSIVIFVYSVAMPQFSFMGRPGLGITEIVYRKAREEGMSHFRYPASQAIKLIRAG